MQPAAPPLGLPQRKPEQFHLDKREFEVHFADVFDHTDFDPRRLEAALAPDTVTLRGLAFQIISERMKKQSRRAVLHAHPQSIDVFASGKNFVLRSRRLPTQTDGAPARPKQRRRGRRQAPQPAQRRRRQRRRSASGPKKKRIAHGLRRS